MEVQSRNPATGEVVSSTKAVTAEEVSSAVRRAVDAWPTWAQRPVSERAHVLHTFANLVGRDAGRLAALITREVGKRAVDAQAEVDWTALSARWYADHPPLLETVDGARIERVPLGVIAAVTPWNVPLVTPAWKWLPALMAGNAVVWKPSELATGIAFEATKLLREAGLPRDVLQVLPGDAHQARSLCADPRVAGVHFTGSTRAGRAINELVAPRFARAALEMGGLNTAIVFPDADVTSAVESVVASGTALTGQKCTAIRRVMVHRRIADEFIDHLCACIEQLTVGPPDDPAVDVGPMVTADACHTAEQALTSALERGGKILARSGGIPQIAETTAAAYFSPVVITGLAPGDPLKREEVFAPILVLDVFDDGDDVWGDANASGYGLAGAVYTNDSHRVAEATRSLTVGVLAINGRSDAVGLEQPFGGRGLSGSGLPEGGRYVYAAVTDTVAIYDSNALTAQTRPTE